jgi:ribosomal protein S18 acetylase RimI-like enzyme
MAEIHVRRAQPADDAAVVPLLYLPARDMYDIYAGGTRRAPGLIAAALARRGNLISREAVSVAMLGGKIAGVLAASPSSEAGRRNAAFLRLALRRLPPWRWPRVLRVEYTGAGLFPDPPPRSLYIDTLATGAEFRRRGVAGALLDAAAAEARARGLRALALDTTEANAPARALYERHGFLATHHLPARGVIPPEVIYVRELA